MASSIAQGFAWHLCRGFLSVARESFGSFESPTASTLSSCAAPALLDTVERGSSSLCCKVARLLQGGS